MDAESLKRSARMLESEIERRLEAYHTEILAAESGGSAVSALQAEVHEKLCKLTELEAQFEEVVDALSSAAVPNKATSGLIVRFQQVRVELRSVFARYKAEEKLRYEAIELQQGANSASTQPPNSAADHLLRERGSLLASHRAIDDSLANASHTVDALGTQRRSLGKSVNALTTLQTLFPNASALIGRIATRRSYNDAIVAVTVAVFLALFLISILRSA